MTCGKTEGDRGQWEPMGWFHFGLVFLLIMAGLVTHNILGYVFLAAGFILGIWYSWVYIERRFNVTDDWGGDWEAEDP